MVDHDALVGKLLKTVDDLGLTENTHFEPATVLRTMSPVHNLRR
jgi:hypothetical protein